MDRTVRLGRRLGIVLAATVVAISVGLVSAPVALAGTCPGPCLGVGGMDGSTAIRPAGIDSTASSEVLDGLRVWHFNIDDQYPVATTNATISVQSGYPASSFGGPLLVSTPVLNHSGQSLDLDLISTIPVSFSPGFDSTRSMDPAVIPVGGGQQSVQVTYTATNAANCGPNGCLFGGGLTTGLGGGGAIGKVTGPSNLNQQGNFIQNPGPAGVNWTFAGVLGKTYTVTVTLNLPDLGHAYSYKPSVWVLLGGFAPQGCGPNGGDKCTTSPTKSLTLADATLDGGTPGAGKVTFSSDQPFLWDAGTPPRQASIVQYSELQSVYPPASPTPAATLAPTPASSKVSIAPLTATASVAVSAVPTGAVSGSTGSSGDNGNLPLIGLILGGLLVVGGLAGVVVLLHGPRAVRPPTAPPGPTSTTDDHSPGQGTT
jgi:hypothetical protein